MKARMTEAEIRLDELKLIGFDNDLHDEIKDSLYEQYLERRVAALKKLISMDRKKEPNDKWLKAEFWIKGQEKVVLKKLRHLLALVAIDHKVSNFRINMEDVKEEKNE